MLIDNTVMYTKEMKIEIGAPGKSLYYFFDYDDRSFPINMEFQHFHPFYEICIYLDREAGHIIDGIWYDMRCCDIVLLRPALLHKTVYPEGEPCKRLIIQFSIPSMRSHFLDDCMKTIYSLFEAECPIYRFEGGQKRAVLDKINDIWRLAQAPNELTELSIHNKFVEFLSTMWLYRDHNTYSNNAALHGITDKVYDITAYIHRHYPEPLSLEQISREFYISSYYLSHQFKQITGFSFTQYVQMTRVSNAQALLISCDDSITDIALQCGFTSFSQFNRVFNKFVGKSPSLFRKEAKDIGLGIPAFAGNFSDAFPPGQSFSTVPSSPQ
ncbi:MAG: AraC family transcriptional regulator [Lachnospiraceae bacterium]|nr:AraC family transcriptional regulator [Lachnospiraceae bacterium]